MLEGLGYSDIISARNDEALDAIFYKKDMFYLEESRSCKLSDELNDSKVSRTNC